MLQFQTYNRHHASRLWSGICASFICMHSVGMSFHCFTSCTAGRMAGVARVKEFSKILCKSHVAVLRGITVEYSIVSSLLAKWQHLWSMVKTKTSWVLLQLQHHTVIIIMNCMKKNKIDSVGHMFFRVQCERVILLLSLHRSCMYKSLKCKTKHC